MSDEEEYLYCISGDEYMKTDWVDVYETWADDNGFDPSELGTEDLPSVPKPLVIEKWTVQDADEGIMSASSIIEHVTEWYSDDCGFSEAGEAMGKAGAHPDVVAAFEAARQVLASKFVGWRMAKDMVGTVTITFHPETAEPMFEGEPLYRTRPIEEDWHVSPVDSVTPQG